MTPTERALILAKREGYEKAMSLSGIVHPGVARNWARSAYPMTETRERVVIEALCGGAKLHWRVRDGRFQTADFGADTPRWTDHWLTVDFLRTLLDLAERPTETVAVDEDTAADEPAIPRCAP